MTLFNVCRDGFIRKDVVTRRGLSEAQGLRDVGLECRSYGTTNDSSSLCRTSNHHGTHDATHLQHL